MDVESSTKILRNWDTYSLCSLLMPGVNPNIWKGRGGVQVWEIDQMCHICDIESVQYYATLAITLAMREKSREKLYQELGVESLKGKTKLPFIVMI